MCDLLHMVTLVFVQKKNKKTKGFCNTQLRLMHTDLPEADNLSAAVSVVCVDGVSLQVCQIDPLHTTPHLLCGIYP